MGKRQGINGTHILTLCLFALIQVGEANQIQNPRFQTGKCKIDPRTHTCIVHQRYVKPWLTTKSDQQLELSTLADLSALFGKASPHKQSRALMNVLRQYPSQTTYQFLPSLLEEKYSFTFEAIGGDLKRKRSSASLIVIISANYSRRTERVSVSLDGDLHYLTAQLTLDSDFTSSPITLSFFLVEQLGSCVVLGVTNLNFKLLNIIDGNFEVPKLDSHQDFRRVRGTQVQKWTIFNQGFLVRWIDPTRFLKQGFMFRSKFGDKFQISQDYFVEKSGTYKLTFSFKYYSPKIAKGVLKAQTGSSKALKIVLDPLGKHYLIDKTYDETKDIPLKEGTNTLVISVKAITPNQQNIFFSGIKIELVSAKREKVKTKAKSFFQQWRDNTGASVSGQSAQGSRGATPQSGPSRMQQSNFLSNGDFSQPIIPKEQTMLRVTKNDVVSWNIEGVGWLKRYPFMKNQFTQGFLFRIQRDQYLSLEQSFWAESSILATLSFIYKLDSQLDPKSTLSVSLNGKIETTIKTEKMAIGTLYFFSEKCFCFKGSNTLSFITNTLSNDVSLVLIFDVSIKPLKQQKDSQDNDSDSERGAVGGEPRK